MSFWSLGPVVCNFKRNFYWNAAFHALIQNSIFIASYRLLNVWRDQEWLHGIASHLYLYLFLLRISLPRGPEGGFLVLNLLSRFEGSNPSNLHQRLNLLPFGLINNCSLVCCSSLTLIVLLKLGSRIKCIKMFLVISARPCSWIFNGIVNFRFIQEMRERWLILTLLFRFVMIAWQALSITNKWEMISDRLIIFRWGRCLLLNIFNISFHSFELHILLWLERFPNKSLDLCISFFFRLNVQILF